MSAATESAASGRIRFEYRALRTSGALELGVVDAASADEVRTLLAARGLFTVDVARPQSPLGSEARIPPEHLAAGLRLLGSLLGAGLPIDRALQTFIQIAPTGWRTPLLDALRTRVREGERLSDALHAVVHDLPPFVRGLVAAGDANGALAEGISRAAEELEAANAARAALRAALAYPTLLAVAGVVSVGVLVGIVLPRFALLLAELGETLPWSTRLLLDLSGVARAAALPGSILITLVLLGWHRWLAADPGARIRWANGLLRLPVYGRIRSMSAGARVTATLGALLATRVPLTAAIDQAASASGDDAIRARLADARERVLTGESLSRALDLSRAVPTSAIQVLRAGEATGEVASMLIYAARLDRERVQSQLRALVRLVEPVMILLFGGLVALVAASLLQAVYAVRPSA